MKKNMYCLFFFLLITTSNLYAKKTIVVKDIHEFLSAIGSDRTIKINTERIVFSTLEANNNPFLKIIKTDKGTILQIEGVKNLEIIGNSKFCTKIINNNIDAYTLFFKEVENLKLTNLQVGQNSHQGIGEGGALYIENGKNITLKNCVFWADREGIKMKNVSEVICKNSIIKNCKTKIMTLEDTKNVSFEKSEFIYNQGLDLFDITYSDQISFNKCTIAFNVAGRGESYDNYALFQVPTMPGAFRAVLNLKDCKIQDNLTQFFCRSKEMIKLEKCDLDNNNFEKGYHSLD